MNYFEVINLIFSIIMGIYTLMVFHFVVFFIIGLFHHKKFPQNNTINSFAFIIGARNEEAVIGNLIESIKKCNYPQDKIKIFVVAHNCTDNTALYARKSGAIVYEYNNPNECTKGYALKYLFNQIEKDYKISSFDGYFIVDSDNILEENFIKKMNDTFMYYDKKYIVTSFRNSKNFGSNIISSLYGLYFVMGCRFESRGRTVTGCSTRIAGTGFLMPSSLLLNGWNYVTLTEDWELSADQILQNNKIVYCDEAVFFDEQPTNFKIMWRQRVRWSRGHWLVCKEKMGEIIKGFFDKTKKRKGSLYDISMNILPFCLILLGINVLQFIFLLFTPLFTDLNFSYVFINNPTYSFIGNIVSKILGVKTPYEIFGNTWTKLLFGNAYLYSLARTFIFYYIGMVLWSILTYIVENKRIKNVSIGMKIISSLAWPTFLILQFLIDIQAILSKNLAWKPIPHKDKTRIHNLK